MDIQTYNIQFLKEYQKFKVTHNNRRAKLQRITENRNICPECGANIDYDRDRCEEYCTECGLITSASIPYSGNRRVMYPFGLLL